jgi:hypothetical protein
VKFHKFRSANGGKDRWLALFCRAKPRRAMSVIRGRPADICSMRVLRILTHLGHRTAASGGGRLIAPGRGGPINPRGREASFCCSVYMIMSSSIPYA